MGVSTDATISYGILLADEAELPWTNETYDYSIDDWWAYKVHGFKHSKELFNAEGNYINGVKPPEEDIEQYFKEKRDFLKDHPYPPLEVTNACSGDYPVYILTLAQPGLTVHRGYPQSFDPAALVVTDEQRNMLIEFCKTYEIETVDLEPKWWLSSYYG